MEVPTVDDPETGLPVPSNEPAVAKMESSYQVRYLSFDSVNGIVIEIPKSEYDTRKSAGATDLYRAALVGCTYHCG